MIDTILDPQIWLVLVAVVHAVVGVILNTEWEDDTNKLVSGWFLLTSVTMLGTAFLLEGEEMPGWLSLSAAPDGSGSSSYARRAWRGTWARPR